MQRAGWAVLLGLAVATCRDAPTGPGRGQRAYLALAPVLPQQAANLAAFGLAIDSLRVVIVRPPTDTVVDTTVAFAADQDSIALALPLTLTASFETFDVALELRGGAFVLFSATTSVDVQAGAPGTNAPVEISNFVFTGPGAGVTTLLVSPVDSVIRLGDSLRFRVDAFAGATPVTQFYVSWSTSNTTLAPINAHGVLDAPNQRGAVIVTATTPTGVTGSVPVTFVPVPTAVAAVLPIPQNVLPGVPIGPLRAQVLAGDGLGVKGIPVTFQAVSGGGSVQNTLVVSDTGGYAETPATAGAGPVSVYTATVAGVATPATFNVTVLTQIATQLAYSVPPAGAVVDLPFGVVVEVRDAQGNVVAGATNPVTITLGANPGGAILGGTLTVNAVQGIALFGDLTINQPDSGYTLVASAPGLATATSPPFTVIPGFTGRLWTNPAGGNWSNPANWQDGIVPAATDSAYILLDGDYTVTLDVNVSIGALFMSAASGTQTLSGLSRTLQVDHLLSLGPTAVLDLTNSTIAGPTGQVFNAGAVRLQGTTVAGGLVNFSGASLLARGATVINGAFLNANGALTRVEGDPSCCTASLTVNGGLSNSGLLELTAINSTGTTATLDVPAGDALNLADGTIAVLPGTGGLRVINGQLINFGLLQIEQDVALALPGADHENTGTIQLNGGNFTVNQSGTAPSFTTTGTIVVGAGRTLSVNGGVFDYDNTVPGGLAGVGTVSFFGTSVRLGPDLANDSLTLGFVNATVNGPGTLTNALSRTLIVQQTAINAPLVNQGTFVARGASNLNGALTAAASGTIRLQGDPSCCVSTLTVATGFTNNGLIELTAINSTGTTATLDLTSGTLVNAPGAVIAAMPGTGGARNLQAQLDNQGILRVEQSLLLDKAGADHLNSGEIGLPTGNLTILQSGSTPTFTMSGRILVESGRTLQVNGGEFHYADAAQGGLQGPGTIDFNGVTVGLTPNLVNDQLTLSFVNATVNGPGTLTNGAGRTLIVQSTVINSPLVNQGLFVTRGASSLGAGVTTSTGSTIQLQGDPSCCVSTLTVPGGFTNNGLLELTAINSTGTTATLDVPSGFLVNAPGATIAARAGSGGARNILTALSNQGTLLIETPSSLGAASADHVNSGLIHITGGPLILSQNGTTPTFTTSGSIVVAAGQSLNVGSGAFNYANASPGGLAGLGSVAFFDATVNLTPALGNDSLTLSFQNSTVTGPGSLTNAAGRALTIQQTAINAPFVNQGLLVARGASSLGGSVTAAAGGTIRVQGDPACCVGTLTVANPLTNDGLIELTAINSTGTTATLDVAGGVTNGPGGTIAILPGTGGARLLNASLINHGALNVAATATLSATSGEHNSDGTIVVSGGMLTIPLSTAVPTFTNGGAFQVAGGATVAVTGGPTGTFVNGSNGTLSGTGTFDVAATTFINDGTVAAGGSPGTLTFTGGFPMSSGAVLSVEIGGLTAGTQYDQLVVSGTATVGGTLNVSLISGFTPAIGNTFTVLTAGGLLGGFALQNFPVVAGASWQVATAGNTVVLSLVSSTQAAVKTWNNLAGGVWSNPANWTPFGVPTASDSVVITAAAPYTVTVDVAANAFFLNLGGPIGAGSRVLALAGQALTLAAGGLVSQAGVLNLSAGTLTGGGDVVIQSSMNWSGGTVSGVGSLTVSPGGTLTLSGGTHSLITRSLLNQGSVVWTAGNINGSSTTLQNAGLFDIQANAATILWASGTTPVFENLPAGVVRRSAGTGAAVFDVTLNQAGSFEVETGRIELTRGSTSTADFVVQPGTTLEFAAGTHVLQAGVDFVGAGVVELTNAMLDIAATDTVQVSRLHQVGGTLLGTGVLRPDSLVWTAGTQAGTGATHVAAGATLLVGGGVSWQRPLVNQGTIRWTAGNISGGSVTLLNTGLFDMQAPTATLLWGVGGTPPVLDNQGTVLRRVGTGTLTVDVTLNNAGTFDVQTGRVEFTRGGTTSTDLTVQPGTTLEFVVGTYVIGTNADIVGTGLVELTSAVLDIAATDTVQVSRLHQLGGTLLGTGALRPDSLVWTAGTQSGTGSTYIAPGATLLVNGGVSWQRPLVNQGTILWTAGNISGGPVTLLNTGLFDMQPSAATLLWGVGGTPPVLDNQGTVLRRVGAGALTVDVTLNHTGTFDVQTGRVELTRGGTIATDLLVQPGTTLEFASGTYNLSTGMDVVGTGLVELTSAVLDVAAADTVQLSRMHQLGGTLLGTGVLRPDSLVWTAGTQAGLGATHIAAGGTLLVNGGVSWQRPLVNQGTLRWTAGNISGGPVTLLNTGLFDMQAPTATLLWGTGGTPPVLDNQGTVLRRVGPGTLTVDVTLNHTGTFDVQTGRVELTRGGTITADLTVQPGTTLEFVGSTYTFNTGADVAGTGLTELTGATLDLAAVDTVQVSRLHQLGGTIQGAGVLRADSLVWSAGTQAGAGTTLIASGATTLVTGSITLNRPLTNQGTLLWTAGNISGGAVTLRSTGLFDVRTNNASILIGGGTPLVLDNAGGTVLRRGSTGVATFNTVTNNAGTIDVQTGTLSLERGGSGTGLYNVSGAAATLRFGGVGAHTLGAGGKINGAGLVNFTGVDVTMSGTGSSYDVAGTTQIVAGIVTLNTPDTARFTTLNQLGGTLRGSAPFLVRGLGTWSGGNLEGAAGSGLRIPVGASLAITGAATKGFTGRTILASGSVSWISGSINAAADAVLDMQPNTTFDVASTGQWSGLSTIEIRDLATMKVTTTGSVTIGPSTVLNNSGTLDIQAGASLKLSGEFNNLGRGILMGSGVLDVGGSPKVTNVGTVRPGGTSVPGILTIIAPNNAEGWPQASGTILDIDVFGPAEGTGHDKLVISGRITTGGSLRLIGNGTYQPRTVSLQIMTFGAQVGQTFSVGLLGGLTGLLGINYSLTDLRMVF